MYAIWLTFSKSDREYLKNVIDVISEKYHAPKFEPHITVYGLINLKLDLIDNVINEVAHNCNSFIVKKSDILQSEELWKTVYIELKMNQQLKSVNENLKKHFEKTLKYEFNPHISLIYKILPKEEKIKIVNELNLKNEFTIDKIVVQEFFSDIEKWKIVKIQELIQI
ncbi:2'-5' RNA ligase family protein [Candidatus Nitrosarchaeum limnium]|jgi:2'-5' RNA ligase|uniref:Cyclic phosphodiesterase-like protein n=1 Tax=Candidatus Nitrosarchaeum limnium BG20 TaxID=859192 RepID=S2E7X0_9ARCH|nr:2'-5' RNA ligase family protein [Candidatus Nitrosarchaeum limnium]EPA05516.1 cyclic phosphodiesterase-like protein [Candidatus Nitrosarchaeum limnium BG20]